MARYGLTGFLVGYLFGLFFSVLALLGGASLASALVVPVFLLGLPGLVIGLVVGQSHRNAFARRAAAAAYAPPPPPAPRVNDAWSRLLAGCEDPVRRSAAAVRDLPPSPARDWVWHIVAGMEAELPTARHLAETGRRLHPPRQPRLTEHPLWLRLREAGEAFAASERRVGEVVAQLVAQPDLNRVDDQLQLLEQQLPHLRPTV